MSDLNLLIDDLLEFSTHHPFALICLAVGLAAWFCKTAVEWGAE